MSNKEKHAKLFLIYFESLHNLGVIFLIWNLVSTLIIKGLSNPSLGMEWRESNIDYLNKINQQKTAISIFC
jgi:hypothetical protein